MDPVIIPIGFDCNICCGCVISQPPDGSVIGYGPALADTSGPGACCAPFAPNGECSGFGGQEASWETVQVTDFETPGLGLKLFCGENDLTDEATWLLEIDTILGGPFIVSCVEVGALPSVTITDPTDPNSTVKFTGLYGLSFTPAWAIILATATIGDMTIEFQYAYAAFVANHTRVCIEGGECP